MHVFDRDAVIALWYSIKDESGDSDGSDSGDGTSGGGAL